MPERGAPVRGGGKRGPKTGAGRAAVRQNAWKHGIRSEHMVVPGREDAREWEAHRDGTLASLAPEGHLEFMLAERIAITLWKQRRLDVYHMAVTTQSRSWGRLDKIASSPGKVKQYFKTGMAGVEAEEQEEESRSPLLPSGWFLPTIMRYESHLHRLMIQTLHELEAMQTRRKGGSSPLARLDITGAPAT